MPSTKSPNPIDVHVGQRIRQRRMMLKMSQGKLGDCLGITFQQIQKYEKGTNRIGASRLAEIAEALKAPVSLFFEGAPDLSDNTECTAMTDLRTLLDDPINMSMIQAFNTCPADVKHSILNVTRVASTAHAGTA